MTSEGRVLSQATCGCGCGCTVMLINHKQGVCRDCFVLYRPKCREAQSAPARTPSPPADPGH